MAGLIAGSVMRERQGVFVPTPSVEQAALVARRVVPPLAQALPGRAVRRRVAPPAESHAPAVLVPSAERQALVRLAAALGAGDEHAAAAVRRLGTASPIVIAPIRIEPVIVPPIKEGTWEPQ